MLLTLSQIISHATRLAQASLLPASIVSEYANVAIDFVSQAAGIQHAPKEGVTFASTSTSDNRLAFPANYDYALGLKIGVPNSNSTATSRTTSWAPLTKQPAPWGDPYQSDTSGIPRDYAEFATWFELRPSPNSSYSIELRYVQKLSELTLSTATPALDEQWHWAVAVKTAEFISAFNSDTTNEALNARRYVQAMGNARTDQGKRRMDERGAYVTVAWRRR